MRRVWASVVSVWALLAIVAALAWTRQPPTQVASPPVATTLFVKGKHGALQRIVVVGTATANATHATTQASPPPLP
jgi:cyanate permease